MEQATTTPEQHTTAWDKLRATGIGGSEAAAAMGLDPWMSPFALFSIKAGLVEPRRAGKAAEWGKRHERTILDWYRCETRRAVIPPADWQQPELPSHCIPIVLLKDGERVISFRSVDHPHMLATPDALIHDREKGWGVLEVKTTRMADAWKEGVPEYVNIQLQHYLAVTGLQWGAVAVLINGSEDGHVDVERDEQLIERIRTETADMWRRIVENDPPEADDTASTGQTLRELYGTSSGEVVELPDDADALVDDFLEARAEAKEWTERKRKAETKLRALMGAAKEGHTPAGSRVLRVDVSATTIEEHTRAASSYFRVKPGPGR